MSLALPLADGRTLPAQSTDRWLLCDSPAAAAAPGELLAQNAALRPPLKLVWDAAWDTRLRVEWPVESAHQAVETVPRLASLLVAETAGPSGAALFALAESAGWPATQRNEQVCAVTLEADAHATALLAARDGAVRAVVEMARLSDAPDVCREAVAVLLLRVAGDVRFVRSVLAEGCAWLEAAYPVTPDAAELGEGLAALSVAWRMSGREAALLAADTDLAADFLTLRASPRPPFANKNQSQVP